MAENSAEIKPDKTTICGITKIQYMSRKTLLFLVNGVENLKNEKKKSSNQRNVDKKVI